MKKKYLIFSVILIFLISLFLVLPKLNIGYIIKSSKMRKPVFAGSWYPKEKQELSDLVDNYLGNVQKLKTDGKIKAIIVPHAGYEYSGQIAATAFRQLNDEYENIFLIGPSHRYALKNASILDVDYYSTPLGKVKLSKKAKQMINEDLISSISEAHINEHSLEIELPFLQRQLKKLEIVPILVGEINYKNFKNILEKYVQENDLIVVSVDLSHYHEYDRAIALDTDSIKKILTLNDKGIFNSEIDAPWAVASLLKLAKEKSWKPYLLAYANSGDITGDKKSVVGYSSIIFLEKDSLNKEEKNFLLELARKSIETYLEKGEKIGINEDEIPIKLKEKRACFVTLNKNGKLRGCIGHLLPQVPLYECVIENSINAAINDKRFEPVVYDEIKDIKIDISVLSVPKLLEYKNSDDLIKKLNDDYGVILKRGLYQSTYLPSVWKQIPDKKEFLSNLCIKGGMEKECWKNPYTKVYVYTTEEFAED